MPGNSTYVLLISLYRASSLHASPQKSFLGSTTSRKCRTNALISKRLSSDNFKTKVQVEEIIGA